MTDRPDLAARRRRTPGLGHGVYAGLGLGAIAWTVYFVADLSNWDNTVVPTLGALALAGLLAGRLRPRWRPLTVGIALGCVFSVLLVVLTVFAYILIFNLG